jgi:outer membrane protein assembly factor BamA
MSVIPRAAVAALWVLAAHPVTGAGDEGPPAPAGTTVRPPETWFAFPVAFYMPETRFGFGGIGGVHFRLEPTLETSDVQAIATATVKQQALLNLRSQLFLSESLALGGAVRLSVYPDVSYGIGNDTPRSAREAFTSRSFEIQLSPEWYLAGRLRSGPRVWFREETFGDLAPGGSLASGRVAGTAGYASAALGWGMTFDSRDSRFSPRRGRYVEASYLLAPGAFGDRLRFGRGALDARQFLPLGTNVVLGIAGHAELAHGSVPFTLLPRVGGDTNLRGYYEGRWRDRLLYSGQAELRVPVAGRFGGVVFAGLSDVAARPSEFGTRTLRPAAGVGARFRLTDDGVNVRLDAGVGQEGANVYFNLGEAF